MWLCTHSQHTFQFKLLVEVHVASYDPFKGIVHPKMKTICAYFCPDSDQMTLQKEVLSWNMHLYCSRKQWFEVKIVLMLDLFQLLSSPDVWTGVVCIIVMFLSSVWTLILTAPIHCRASIAEREIKLHISLKTKQKIQYNYRLIIKLKLIKCQNIQQNYKNFNYI